MRALVEDEQGRWLPAAARRRRELRRHGGLPGPGRPDDEGAGPLLDATAQQGVQFRDLAGQAAARRRLTMLGGDQAREHLEPTLLDDVVVVPAPIPDSAILDDAEPATLGPELGIELFEPDDPVRDALHLQVVVGGGHIVEQDDGAVAHGEEMLQRENLPTVTQRRAGEQTQFRQGVEHHPRGLEPFDVGQNQLRRRRELELGRMEHRVLPVGVEGALVGGELTDGDAVQRPAV